ncbi:hypothetical protein KAZ93_01720 [Patescibacteria group bacterium]|nr:hypothetical protein [Patescibacteria group bacterium]
MLHMVIFLTSDIKYQSQCREGDKQYDDDLLILYYILREGDDTRPERQKEEEIVNVS